MPPSVLMFWPTGIYFHLFLQYALPAIAIMLISSLYNIAVKAFVGNFIG